MSAKFPRGGAGPFLARSLYRIRNQGNCVRRLISTELYVSVFCAETISSDKMSIDISDTF